MFSLNRTRCKGKGLNSYINQNNQHLCNPDAMDLLAKLLTYDHALRPTAKEAMEHKYFDSVRNLDWHKTADN